MVAREHISPINIRVTKIENVAFVAKIVKEKIPVRGTEVYNRSGLSRN